MRVAYSEGFRFAKLGAGAYMKSGIMGLWGCILRSTETLTTCIVNPVDASLHELVEAQGTNNEESDGNKKGK